MTVIPRPLRFAVIGAGMSGILSLIELRRAGFTDLVAYEKGGRVGGTWRENTYPGIACDVPSHVYSYSFEPNPDWSRQFSPGEEILAYFEDVARRHDVVDLIRFGTEVTDLRWTGQRWDLRTADGGTDTADVVIAATGVLHHPNIPDFRGLESFGGHAFHSARWNHDLDLSQARVGVVGTGSTAVQITSALAGQVAEYTLFQRTPQWVLAMDNPEIPADTRNRFRTDPQAMLDLRTYLAGAFRDNFADVVIDAESPRLAEVQALCEENLDRVKDPELREALRPDYRAACKRLVVSPDFYEAMQRPNTHLVTSAIEAVEPDGIRTADGELHELDVLVLATGFRPDRFLRPIRVRGRDGLDLEDVWGTHPTAYLSMSVPEFPNLFLVNGPNGPIGNFSIIDVAEKQWGYLAQLLEPLAEGRCTEICATREATDAHEQARQEAVKNTIWVSGCRSWYLDDRGIPAAWPWTMQDFADAMATPDTTAYEYR